MMSNAPRAMAVLTLMALLGGCSGLTSQSSVPVMYQLRAASPARPGDAASGPGAAARYDVAVRVERAIARPGYDTDRILVLRPGLQLDWYASSRWAGPLPDVVTGLVQDTLRASGSYLAVNDAAAPLQSDYALRISIRRFEADYSADSGAPTVQVAFDCTLGRRSDRGVVATFSAEASVPAADDRMTAVIAAFDAATATALRSTETQTLAAIAADTRTP